MARRNNRQRRAYRIPTGAILAAGAVPAAGAVAYANRDRAKRVVKRAQQHVGTFTEGAVGYSPFSAEVARARRRRLRRTGTAAERVDDAKRVQRAAKYAAATGLAAAAAGPIGRGVAKSLLGPAAARYGGVVARGAVLGLGSAAYYGRRAAAEAGKARGGTQVAG